MQTGHVAGAGPSRETYIYSDEIKKVSVKGWGKLGLNLSLIIQVAGVNVLKWVKWDLYVNVPEREVCGR